MSISWLFLILVFSINSVMAFDDDRELSFPDFNRENFLDMAGYQYRKQLDDDWYAADNGFRLSGGSLGQDYLYTILDFKLRAHINDYTELRLTSQQEAFYTVKPIYVQVEIGVRPISWLYLSILGNPTHDKRSSDMGSAIEIGSRPLNYFRFSYIRHDVFYNDKNSQDDGYYEQQPIERQLEVASHIQHKLKFRMKLIQDSYFSQIFATDLLGNQGQFNHEGDSGSLLVDYHFFEKQIVGFKLQGFNSHKQLITSVQNRRQNFRYLSVQNYLILPVLNQAELTLGWRHDQLDYDTQDLLDINASVERYFDTSQIYGILLVPHRQWLNLEYALHLGEARLKQEFINDVPRNMNSSGIESKFRFSMELLSKDKNNRLMFSSNWNLDDLRGKFWDGGHISFQGMF